jgi:hypothetical protein
VIAAFTGHLALAVLADEPPLIFPEPAAHGGELVFSEVHLTAAALGRNNDEAWLASSSDSAGELSDG